MYSRILEPRGGGAIHLTLEGYNSNITFEVDSRCRRAQIEAYAEVNSGPTVEAIDRLALRESSEGVELVLPAEATGGTMISSFGGTSVMNISSGVVVSGGTIAIGRGDADMMINGKRIQVRGGKTYINGKLVEGDDNGAAAGDPPAVIHLRAILPPGSSAKGKSYNGDVHSVGVTQVRLKSYNGDVRALGVGEESKLKSYNGNIAVGAVGDARPQVWAETYNGDISVLDDNVRLRPKTYNGDVLYPR